MVTKNQLREVSGLLQDFAKDVSETARRVSKNPPPDGVSPSGEWTPILVRAQWALLNVKLAKVGEKLIDILYPGS